MYPNGSPFLLAYLGYNMTYEPTIHIQVLWQLMFTKHSTHMAYISKPLVRKFRILWIRRFYLFKFEIFQAILRNRSALTPIFLPAVYFHFTNIIDMTCGFNRRSFNIFWKVILCYIRGIKRGHFGLRSSMTKSI